MLLNFLTPSPAKSAFDGDVTGSAYLRIFSNPKPVQTDYYEEGEQLVNFGLDFLNKIPVIWTFMIVVIAVGAIYYLLAQRRKPFIPVVPPDEAVQPMAGMSA
jgi:hypothetical protein